MTVADVVFDADLKKSKDGEGAAPADDKNGETVDETGDEA